MEDMEGLKNKRILVTGGTGFIGSHLVLELIKKGANVFVVDIEVNPKSFFALNRLLNKSSLEILDIRDKNKVSDYFDKFNFNYVFHLAAEPIVEEAYKNPHAAFETNIMGTVNILEAARASKNIKGIIVASSDKAYGKTDKPYKENFPLRADHPYDVSKACADLISQAYYVTYGLPIVVTRFGNVYGEGDLHTDRIVPGICEAVIKNNTLEVRSDGTYIRDYIYVEDIVNGCLLLLKNLEDIRGEAYNFSSKDNLSVLNVIQKAEKSLGKKIKYKILNNAKNEIPYQHLDDGKIRKLGWKSVYSLENTLPKILNWYKEIL